MEVALGVNCQVGAGERGQVSLAQVQDENKVQVASI